ncbi:hypothetical protein MHY01S_15080 [Meiothermus hypogaeus NBRC 106114]|uniref:Uncharacterized protein n=1 Tax=Meiothermus hypogaeus NBRC 106114 TaxID=1227553 RepID=A0A511R389_9DEIN|nr:hypothetical protein MHY01S_15080 [Meiothermus hypogaeus NBRC 106114]
MLKGSKKTTYRALLTKIEPPRVRSPLSQTEQLPLIRAATSAKGALNQPLGTMRFGYKAPSARFKLDPYRGARFESG